MTKRIIILVLFSVFIFITMASCHTTEPPCPAYAFEQGKNAEKN